MPMAVLPTPQPVQTDLLHLAPATESTLLSHMVLCPALRTCLRRSLAHRVLEVPSTRPYAVLTSATAYRGVQPDRMPDSLFNAAYTPATNPTKSRASNRMAAMIDTMITVGHHHLSKRG